jgi:hypothetical protein
MKASYRSRSLRRHRRPVPLPVTRFQIRQKVDRLRDLYELDINYLLQLDLESSFLRDVLASIEEKI